MLFCLAFTINGLLSLFFFTTTYGFAVNRAQDKNGARTIDNSLEAEFHRNLVHPGNFEDGTWGNWTLDPDYYNPEGEGPYGVTYPGYKSKSAGYFDNYSFVSNNLYYPNITLKEERQYHFSMHVRMSNPGACSLAVGHGITPNDILGIGGIYPVGDVVANKWFMAEGYFVASDAKGQIVLNYGCFYDTEPPRSVNFDNIKLVLTPQRK